MTGLNLQGIRTTYLFEANSPPFPLLADVLSHLHTQTRAKVDRIVLTRALELSNQATFVYTILRPDEAVSLYPDHGRGDGNDNLEKRDAILRAAWKAFWIVIVRSAEGTSRSALRLWLDFATQVNSPQTFQADENRYISCTDVPPSYLPRCPIRQLKHRILLNCSTKKLSPVGD